MKKTISGFAFILLPFIGFAQTWSLDVKEGEGN